MQQKFETPIDSSIFTAEQLAGHPVGGQESFRSASAHGWPLVLYFHHVHPTHQHYTSLRPESFVRALDLVLEKFAPVSLDDLIQPDGTFSAPPQAPSVLFTFDDGYADVLEVAVPAMQDRGISATFFVCTGLLGQRSENPAENYLSWSNVGELAAAGHTIAAHGVTHRPLPDLSQEEVDSEVRDSLTQLRERAGVTLPAYAFPYGLAAPIPRRVDGFTSDVVAFGTVKAAPRPWTEAPQAIRRVYLPTDQDDSWPGIVNEWRIRWELSA
ncbi:MAG TPA: polysaccharide deacetylase family protein [Kineosporiaceae bacterium]|nr:polysaccharide deacetylase family protein [Kineosporiaceae bacterium]